MKKSLSKSLSGYPAKLHIKPEKIIKVILSLARKSKGHMGKADPREIERILLKHYDPKIAFSEIIREAARQGEVIGICEKRYKELKSEYRGLEHTPAYKKAISELNELFKVSLTKKSKSMMSDSGGLVHDPGGEVIRQYEKAILELEKLLKVKRITQYHERIERDINNLRRRINRVKSKPEPLPLHYLGYQYKSISSMLGAQITGLYDYLRGLVARDSLTDNKIYEGIAKLLNATYSRSGDEALTEKQVKKAHENALSKAE